MYRYLNNTVMRQVKRLTSIEERRVCVRHIFETFKSERKICTGEGKIEQTIVLSAHSKRIVIFRKCSIMAKIRKMQK